MGKYQDVDLAKLTETKEIADAIQRVDAAFAKMMESGLNERAIILLLHDCSGVGKREIASILGWLPRLKETYCAGKIAKD